MTPRLGAWPGRETATKVGSVAAPVAAAHSEEPARRRNNLERQADLSAYSTSRAGSVQLGVLVRLQANLPIVQPSEADMARVGQLIAELYKTVDDLEVIFEGRFFTPDGHLVGSIGESLAAYVFNLDLMPASNTGFDAKTRDGRTVEIKATQGTSIALYDSPPPDHLIVLKISRAEPAEIVYNGPAEPAWKAAGGAQKNGQRRIALSTLRKIPVEPGQELEVMRSLPPLRGSTTHSG